MVTFFCAFIGLDNTFGFNNCYDLEIDQRHFKEYMMFNKSMLPLVITFLVICGLVFGFKDVLTQKGFDWQMLIGGNIFLYIVTSISMHMLNRGMTAPNTHAFLRNAYGGIMVKLFACAAGAFVYILVAGDNLNKPSLFACMGLYLVYTFLEMRIVLQQSNQKKNG